MLLSEIKESGFFRFRVNLGECFNRKAEDVYIVLGEPTMKAYDRIQKKAETSAEDMAKLMKDCLLEHNIETEPDKLATPEQVMTLLNDFPTAMAEALEKWQLELPLAKRSREKSVTSAPASLEE